MGGLLEPPADTLGGIALVFGEWFLPSWPPGSRERGRVRVRFLPGSLDASLARIRAGKTRAGLRLAHDDGAELVDTTDGLRLWATEQALWFRVAPVNSRARFAISSAARRPEYRRTSAGAEPLVYTWSGRPAPDLPSGSAITIREAELTEVSLVGQAACSGTFAFVG